MFCSRLEARTRKEQHAWKQAAERAAHALPAVRATEGLIPPALNCSKRVTQHQTELNQTKPIYRVCSNSTTTVPCYSKLQKSWVCLLTVCCEMESPSLTQWSDKTRPSCIFYFNVCGIKPVLTVTIHRADKPRRLLTNTRPPAHTHVVGDSSILR